MLSAGNTPVVAMHCLDCHTPNVVVEPAGTERPAFACGPTAYDPSDRCADCGSDELTADATTFEIAVADSRDVELADELCRTLRTATRDGDDQHPAIRLSLALTLRQMSCRGRYVACAALGLDVDEMEAALRG